MSQYAHELIDRFSRLRALVIGEAILDSYSIGQAARLCPDAPAPVVDVRCRRDFCGGAANASANLAALGVKTTLLSAIGDDAEGALLEQIVSDAGVATDRLIRHPARKTLAKHRIVASSQVLVRYDQGDTDAIDPSLEEELLGALDALAPQCDLIVISDYDYGILTPRIIRRLRELARRFEPVLAVDSKCLPRFRELQPTVAKPNYREACELVDRSNGVVPSASNPSDRFAAIAAHAASLTNNIGARIVAVTLDQDGAAIFEQGRPPYHTHARQAAPPYPSGAGDTYLATFAATLAAGGVTSPAAELASAAAGVVVAKEHTATCTAAELLDVLTDDDRPNVALHRLADNAGFYRRQGRRIVLTNGSFDILQRGHITYLRRAKMLGDVLIVGVNSDESIRRLKGPTRPINCLDDRLRVLEALSCVDHVVVFGEETPHELVRAIRPDVFVKGGDYTRETLPEATLVEQFGGRVEILPFVAARSTTRLIDRIIETRVADAHSPLCSPGAAAPGHRSLGRRQDPDVR